jgi:peptidyl-prolyl cis-trans isomerase C
MTIVLDTPTAGCTVKPNVSGKPRTVTVNGVTIPREAIARETQNHPASKPIEAWQAAARALVIRELLLQEATRLEIVAVPLSDGEGRRETNEEARIRALLEQEVSSPVPGEEELQRYYANNLKAVRTPDLYEVAHILIGLRESGLTALQAARERAEGILREVEAEPARFAALAEVHSDCPSRAMGGNLGQISTGQTVPEFEIMLPQLPVGPDRFSIVESRYGFHIVTVHRRIEGRELPFATVRNRIARFLQDRAGASAARHYVQRLASLAAIEGVVLETSSTPLVQ